jgi:hypothetical protein
MSTLLLEEAPLLRPALLEGEEEGCAETLGEAELEHCDLEGLVEGSDQGLEEDSQLKNSLARRRRRGLCRKH